MRDQFAYFISLVFHPLLMPSYVFLFIINYAQNLLHPLKLTTMYQILLIVFLVTFLIPFFSIGSMRLTRLISDLSIEDRKQRIAPFIFIFCFYATATYMFYAKVQVSEVIVVFFAALTFLILILTIITFFWKISVHGAAAGGAIGFAMALYAAYPYENFSIILSLLFILAGLVIYARLSLNAHTPSQAYLGAALGFVVCFFAMLNFT